MVCCNFDNKHRKLRLIGIARNDRNYIIWPVGCVIINIAGFWHWWYYFFMQKWRDTSSASSAHATDK